MALVITSGDMDLIQDAVENVLSKFKSGGIDADTALVKLVGIIDLAATDDAGFMGAVKAAYDA